jgi:hypothetical protein
MNDSIRIFIGTSANGEDSVIETAYEYSLRKNTKRDLQITWMRQTHDTISPWGGWNTQYWPTPFSGFRWAIAEVCNFSGRAIYTDVDMINYRDIGDLWDIDMEGKPIAARRGTRFGGHEFCVSVIDCERIAEHLIVVDRMKPLDNYHQRMIQYFSGNEELVHSLDPRWNVLDGENYKIEDIWQLHFTKMATQPWKPAWFTGAPEVHPRTDIINEFTKHYQDAIAAGYVDKIPEKNFGQYNIIGR